MTALLAIVRSVDEAMAAAGAGADLIAVAAGGTPLGRPRPRLARSGPMVTEAHPEPSHVVRGAFAAGFDRIWLPLSPRCRPAIADAIASGLSLTAMVPLRRSLDSGICDEMVACGVSELLVADAPFADTRVLDVHPIAALASFKSLCRNRGLNVGFAGGIEAPDVPRLLAFDPAFIGLDGLLRDEGDRFGPDRLRAVRSLWASPTSLRSQAQKDSADRIFVRDRVVTMSVGAYARERQAPQRVRFSVEAEIAPAALFATGLAAIVSYDLITDAIERIAAGHVDLVETLAEGVAAAVLAHPRVLSVAITVEKLDLGPGSVGCRIVRSRPT